MIHIKGVAKQKKATKLRSKYLLQRKLGRSFLSQYNSIICTDIFEKKLKLNISTKTLIKRDTRLTVCS